MHAANSPWRIIRGSSGSGCNTQKNHIQRYNVSICELCAWLLPNTFFPAKTGGIFGTLPWELWSSRVLSVGNSSTSDANASSTTESHQR